MKYNFYKKLGDNKFLLDKIFIFLSQRKDINKKNLVKRLGKVYLTCICSEGNNIIGIGCIKPASKKALKELHLNSKQIVESGFFFIDNKYRGKGIGGTIQKKLITKRQKKEIIAITKENNIGMQKILTRNGFNDTKIKYFNNFLDQTVKIYTLGVL